MTEDTEALARRIAEAYNIGLDEFIACHAEDVVHVTSPEWPEAGTYNGREEVRQLWASIFEAGLQKIEIDEIVILDDGRVLSKLRLLAEGATSGATTTTPIYTVATARDQLIAHIQYFMDYDQALEAAGLADRGSA